MSTLKNLFELLAENSRTVAEKVNRLISCGNYDTDENEFPELAADDNGIRLYPNRARDKFFVQIPNHALIVLYGNWDSKTYEDAGTGIKFSWTDNDVFESVFIDFYSVQLSVKGDCTNANLCLAGGAAIT